MPGVALGRDASAPERPVVGLVIAALVRVPAGSVPAADVFAFAARRIAAPGIPQANALRTTADSIPVLPTRGLATPGFDGDASDATRPPSARATAAVPSNVTTTDPSWSVR